MKINQLLFIDNEKVCVMLSSPTRPFSSNRRPKQNTNIDQLKILNNNNNEIGMKQVSKKKEKKSVFTLWPTTNRLSQQTYINITFIYMYVLREYNFCFC